MSTSGGNDGYQLRGTLTGIVFEDTNGDGDQDGGELGIANIDVVVTDFLGNATTVVTNGSGVWTLTAIPDGGDATIDVDENDVDFPAGAVQTAGTGPNGRAGQQESRDRSRIPAFACKKKKKQKKQTKKKKKKK